MTEANNNVKTKSKIAVVIVAAVLVLVAGIGYALLKVIPAEFPATAVATPKLVCNQGQIIGDVNNDKKIDASDVKRMADVIVRNILPPTNYCCADLNKDGRLNTADTAIIGKIVNGSAQSPGVCNNEPKAVGSLYYPYWQHSTWGRGGWPIFYTANGSNMDSQNYVFMTKQTPLIESLAAQIPDGINKHQTVQNIMDWLHQYMESRSEENDYCNYYIRLTRTAEAILTPIPPNNKACAVSCADWGAAFIALARAKGIPAAMVYTISDRWINETLSNGCTDTMYGHVIADVYTSTSGPNAGWELADPTKSVFTVYEKNDYSGYALMRFDAYAPGTSFPAFGSGYRYRVFRRGIDAWETGLISPVAWEKDVARIYGLPTNADGTI
jgi:hypothetical protein